MQGATVMLSPGRARVVAGAALGLTPTVTDADLRAEVLREHLVALCVTLPPLLGQAPGRLPAGDVAGALFGAGLPRDLAGDYDTVAGLVLHQMRRLPGLGEHFTSHGHRFEVLDLDGLRIDKVLVQAV